jgi:hypothetical protein
MAFNNTTFAFYLLLVTLYPTFHHFIALYLTINIFIHFMTEEKFSDENCMIEQHEIHWVDTFIIANRYVWDNYIHRLKVKPPIGKVTQRNYFGYVTTEASGVHVIVCRSGMDAQEVDSIMG